MKLPKWTKRSRRGIYLGISPSHSTSVGRILNTVTGAITPQFHVVFDEAFTSIAAGLPDAAFEPEEWRNLIALQGLERTLDTDLDPSDRHGVPAPIQDYFHDFVPAPPDPASDDISLPSSVPEGDPDPDDDEIGVTSDDKANEGAADQSEDPTRYWTRSGRGVRKRTPYNAATFLSATT